MKTLYLSDLDGTLLTHDVLVSDYTKKALTFLYDEGVYFSAATARTAATVKMILDDVPFRVPVILMNGVATLDLATGKYISVCEIGKEAKAALYHAVCGHSGFLYTIDQGKLSTFYEQTKTEHSKNFMQERKKKYSKVFTHVSSFDECSENAAVYFSVADRHDNLISLRDTLAKIEGLHVEFYRDIYEPEYWYLEVSASGVSKFAAALQLKKSGGFDRMIGFGDNLNDISLFRACDESYAVADAKDEVKRHATGVIGSSNENAVARFIMEREGI